MSRIGFHNVAKDFGSFRAVEAFSLEVRQGELIALLGPSGCGKTTTLRMVAGFIPVSSGRITFDDRDVTDLPPYRRNTGMVFQGYALFPHLTVAENVAYGLEMRRVPKAEIKTRVDEALTRVRLAELSDRLPKQLSGGQQQRVALARALVVKPDVLLLDEPLSNLDAKLRHEVRIEIRQLQQTLGLTTVFVTHDQEEALSVADRLVVMNKGRVEQIGTPTDLYERPATRFVADFIGKSNFFEGRLDGMAFVTSDGMRLQVGPVAEDRRASTLLAVRPEKITIAAAPDRDKINQVRATVAIVTYLGPITEYVVRTRTGTIIQVHRQNRGPDDAQAFKVDDAVALSWPEDACLLL